ncbi:hypothetical protein GCM10022393_23000 [Aquimarina addita]|uniref:histidine kinase n=1 Tax=Aquimarina addita TaxID=870485 RepID=A0ABP6UJG0_9FLAO
MTKESWLQSEAAKYTLYGILFGSIFPIIATSLDIVRLNREFSWASVVITQKEHPIHYIIDTAPVFLGLFAWLGGRTLDKLKETNRQIIKTSKFKQDFLANMSHEIRTPMVGVIGMIDLLFKNTKLDELQKEYVTIVHQSSLNLLNILNQVLDISKIESGQYTLTPKPLNLNNIINQNIDLFLANSKAKEIQLINEYADDLPEYIYADKNRLTQILSNLIGNAIKFTDHGSITVKSTLVSQKNTNLLIKIEVIDTGIGISTIDQKALFNRFTQIHTDHISFKKGSGLGLPICKKLVDLMQGQLGVQSELNKGSNFWFTFTSQLSDEPALTNTKVLHQNDKEEYNLHVLLVEDSEINIIVLKQILKYLGCSSKVAKTGKEAIEMFAEGTYDLILMDINLPDIDGVKTMKEIRKKHKNPPPIIAITSNALPGDAERYIATGMDDYITKPFTTEILNIKLKNWFGDYDIQH